MNLSEYDRLRKKMKRSDFEGKNKSLESWLYKSSFLGNIGSIFFAFFLLYPALFISFSTYLNDFYSSLFSGLFTVVFLSVFEIIKRYVVRNFFHDMIWMHAYNLGMKTVGLLAIVIAIISVSFYFSLSGSKNFASSVLHRSDFKTVFLDERVDSLKLILEAETIGYVDEINKLRVVNNSLRDSLVNTPLNFIRTRAGYQESINSNVEQIRYYQERVDGLNNQFNVQVSELENQYRLSREAQEAENRYNIFLFLIIVIINESLIVFGIFFREFFENKLFLLNKEKYEKVYVLRDRYKTLLKFIYRDGEVSVGDKIMSVVALTEIINERSGIRNSNKFIKEFIYNMDNLSIFVVEGKRRIANVSYEEAINIIDKFDDSFRVLDDLK